jgi:hypothetical protein
LTSSSFSKGCEEFKERASSKTFLASLNLDDWIENQFVKNVKRSKKERKKERTRKREKNRRQSLSPNVLSDDRDGEDIRNGKRWDLAIRSIDSKRVRKDARIQCLHYSKHRKWGFESRQHLQSQQETVNWKKRKTVSLHHKKEIQNHFCLDLKFDEFSHTITN